MKNKALYLTLISAAVISVGCEQKRTTSEQLDNVQAKTADVAEDIRDYSYAQKDEYLVKMRAQLANLNKELDEMAANVEKSSDAVKADAKPRIEALREKTARLNKQLDDVTTADELSWEKFKADVRKTQEASKEEFKQARQWLSDKIAP